MSDKSKSKSEPEPEVTVADQHRVARRPDGSTYLVNVSGSSELPEGTVTEVLDPADVLLPASTTP